MYTNDSEMYFSRLALSLNANLEYSVAYQYIQLPEWYLIDIFQCPKWSFYFFHGDWGILLAWAEIFMHHFPSGNELPLSTWFYSCGGSQCYALSLPPWPQIYIPYSRTAFQHTRPAYHGKITRKIPAHEELLRQTTESLLFDCSFCYP